MREEKGTIEDEMVGWHHRLNGHEFEQAPGVGDGQGGLACCSSWGCKESDMTEQLNGTELNRYWVFCCVLQVKIAQFLLSGNSTLQETAMQVHTLQYWR